MAKPLNIVIKAKDNTSKKLDSISKKFKRFAGDIALAYGAKKVVEAGARLVELAAKAGQTKTALNNMIAEFGITADQLLNDLKRVSGGTVSEMDLMTQAGTALSLNLKPKEIVSYMEVARAAARATGQETTLMFQKMVVGMARQSRLRLDDLGIIMEVGEANKRHADSIGKTVSQLTEQEKRQAFANEAMRQGAILVKRVGVSVMSDAEKLQKMNAQWQDTQVAIGKFIMVGADVPTVLDFWIERFETATDWLEKIVGGFNDLNEMSLNEIIKEERKLQDSTWRAIKLADDLRERNEKIYGDVTNWTAKTVKQYNKAYARQTELENQLHDATKKRMELQRGKGKDKPIVTTEDDTTTDTIKPKIESTLNEALAIQEIIRQSDMTEMDLLLEKQETEKTLLEEHNLWKDENERFYREQENALTEKQFAIELENERVMLQEKKQTWEQGHQTALQFKEGLVNVTRSASQGMLNSLKAGEKGIIKTFANTIGQEAMMKGSWGILEGIFKIGQAIFPPNPAGHAAGIAEIKAGGAMLAFGGGLAAASGGAGGGGSSGGGSSGGGGGGGGSGGGGSREIPGRNTAEREPHRRQKMIIHVDDDVIFTGRQVKQIMETAADNTDYGTTVIDVTAD